MPSLRIVHTLPFAWPATQYGGPVAQLALLLPELAHRGHDVRLVTTDLGIGPEIPRDQWVERDGYRTWYGRAGRFSRPAPYWTPGLRSVLWEELKKTDVAHLHLGLTLQNALASQLANRAGVPYVYSPRGALCPERLKLRSWSKCAFLALFERRTIAGAAALHALTGKERDDLLHQNAASDRVRVVPNGVRIPDVTLLPAKSAVRKQLGIDEKVTVVLFLGQLHAVKGLDLLIRAFAQAKQASPGALLLIAGPDAGYERTTRELVRSYGLEQHVRFLGHLHGNEKILAYRAADLFALTSRSEGMPNVVLEAAAIGLPLLVTDACQVPEVAEFGAGRIVAVEQLAITAALQLLLTDASVRARAASQAFHMVRDRFDIAAVAASLDTIYASVATERAALAHGRWRPA